MTPRNRDLALAGIWLVLDQLTKAWASSGALDTPMALLPKTLRFSLTHNEGALFGFLAGAAEPLRSIFLIGVPLLAVALIATMLFRAPLDARSYRIGLALILGGAIGNVVDRVAYGHVVDFIDVFAGWEPARSALVDIFGTYRWPTFNIADTGLTVGAALLIGDALFHRRKSPAADSDEHASEDTADEAAR